MHRTDHKNIKKEIKILFIVFVCIFLFIALDFILFVGAFVL